MYGYRVMRSEIRKLPYLNQYSLFETIRKFYDNLSLLTWRSCISSMINDGGYNSFPISEARGSLGTVCSGLRANLYIHLA